MAKNRKLKLGDVIAPSPYSRHVNNAARDLENLNQNDQIIRLLTEQNNMLRYIADLLHEERQKRA